MNGSERLFEKALKVTPGGVHSPVRNLNHVGVKPIFFSYGEGPYLHDVDGKTYIDFCLSFGPHILGHCPDPVTRVLKEQVTRGTSFGACHPKEVELSELLLKSYPFLDKVRLVNSGTEALMTALRVARAYTGRSKTVKFEGCYHGHSDALLAKAGSGVATLTESSSKGVPPGTVKDTLITRFDSIDRLEDLFKRWGKQIAAVVLEPIPANAGLWVPKRSLLEQIVSLAHLHGALVIFDEVITGFRVGISGATGHFDLKPDIVTLGKIIGGGLPLAAIVSRAEIMDQLAPVGESYQAGTLSGNPLATAAGCAVLKELSLNPPYLRLDLQTIEFTESLRKILEPTLPIQIQQMGSIFWFYFGEETNAFPPTISKTGAKYYAELFQKAIREGIYLPPSPYEVSFLSTAHDGQVLELALEKFYRCVK